MKVNDKEYKYEPKGKRHKEYKNADGLDVPSVTTILKVLDKPFLVKWANYMGFKRIRTEDVLKESSTIGTIVHDMIENYIINGTVKMSYPEFVDSNIMGKSINAFNGFKMWWSEMKDRVEVIFMEESLSCMSYGGTIDLFCKIDGVPTILDFKTSNQFGETMFLQLLAYTNLLKANNYEEAKEVAILKLSKNEIDYEYVKAEVSKLSSFLDFFNNLIITFYMDDTIKTKFKKIIKGEL